MNADKLKPDVEIQFGEKKYLLRFSTHAAILYEKVTGNFDALDGSELFKTPFQATKLRALLWAMINAGGVEITMEEVADLMEFDRYDEITIAIVQAYKNAMPTIEKKTKSQKVANAT